MKLPQKERGFILVNKNGVIYPKNIVKSQDENSVYYNWYLAPGEVLLGQNHTHQDPSTNTKDRPNFSDEDIAAIKQAHGHQTIQNYTSFIECGDVRYALVIEDPVKAIAFFNANTPAIINKKYLTNLNTNPNYSSNYQLAGQEATIAAIGSAAVSGIGFYKSTNTEKTVFVKIN